MDNLKVSKETICSTIFCFLGVINFFLEKYGMYPIEIEQSVIFDLVSAIWLVVGVVWTWWKNQSFTKPAILSDQVMKDIKNIDPIDYNQLKVDVNTIEQDEADDVQELDQMEQDYRDGNQVE